MRHSSSSPPDGWQPCHLTGETASPPGKRVGMGHRRRVRASARPRARAGCPEHRFEPEAIRALRAAMIPSDHQYDLDHRHASAPALHPRTEFPLHDTATRRGQGRPRRRAIELGETQLSREVFHAAVRRRHQLIRRHVVQSRADPLGHPRRRLCLRIPEVDHAEDDRLRTEVGQLPEIQLRLGSLDGNLRRRRCHPAHRGIRSGCVALRRPALHSRSTGAPRS